MSSTDVTRETQHSRFSKGTVVLYLVLLTVACFPIWSIDRFVNQDGSAHVYSASIMLDQLRSGIAAYQPVQINPVPVPNSTGHWLLVLLLTVFSPFIATKITLTLIYAAFLASIAWLRWAAWGREDLNTAVLMGGVLGLNWLWLIGTYSFLIGVIFMFGVFGLFVYWNAALTWKRTLLLSGLLLAAYFSHLIGFVLLLGMISVHSLVLRGRDGIRTIGQLFLAALPVIPFFAAFRTISETAGALDTKWLLVQRGFSFSAWTDHFRTMDPFSLISRRALPLTEQMSDLYGFAAPAVWILIAFASAGVATLYSTGGRKKSRLAVSFAVLFVLFAAGAFVAPDAFGNHGGVIRPRFTLLALSVFTAIFGFYSFAGTRRLVQVILVCVFVFQVAAVYEYGGRSRSTTNQFLFAAQVLEPVDRAASIVILGGSSRSVIHPEIGMSSMVAAVNHSFVWDNYEFGYYQFPVFAPEPADRQFVLKFCFGKVYWPRDADAEYDEKLKALGETLRENAGKIDKLFVSGRDERVEAVLSNWFDMSPIFETQHIRVFRNSGMSRNEEPTKNE